VKQSTKLFSITRKEPRYTEGCSPPPPPTPPTLSGLFGTDAYRHIVSLPLTEFTPSSPEALHTKQAWALSASEGANYIRNLASKSVIFRRTRFFYMPQNWDMGQIILLPLWRKACCGFFQPEKSDSFGREWPCDLGYQRPACKPLDHWSCSEGC
jgi:hypothetical protein